MTLNLFYEEPNEDRWFPLDRFPRRVIRRIVRGPARMGGQRRVFLNLCAGLRRLGVPFRTNDYRHARRNPGETVGIVGKPHVLEKLEWENPILFGASVFSHPIEDPGLMERRPVKRILLPGEWMRRMWEPHFGEKVHAWPVGIDTDLWQPAPASGKEVDYLVYDKLMWERERFEADLLQPIRDELHARNARTAEIRYGSYREEDLQSLLRRSRAMIFLGVHETQGIAYQQALAAGVPILAWDRGGPWQDPAFYPHRVRFGPVTSVPYWDHRCGVKFQGIEEFPTRLDEFIAKQRRGEFAPRDYITENLTLEKCAGRYLDHYRAVMVGA